MRKAFYFGERVCMFASDCWVSWLLCACFYCLFFYVHILNRSVKKEAVNFRKRDSNLLSSTFFFSRREATFLEEIKRRKPATDIQVVKVFLWIITETKRLERHFMFTFSLHKGRKNEEKSPEFVIILSFLCLSFISLFNLFIWLFFILFYSIV